MPVYEMIWRNKFLTTDAKSIDDMISSLDQAVFTLRQMRDAGVTLSDGGGTEDDYAMLVTEDPEVAARFDMEEIALDEEDAEDDDNPD